MDYEIVLFLIGSGLVGGFLSGLLGVGGGIIFVPVIGFALKFYNIEGEEFVRFILANSFAVIFFAGLVSTYKNYKLGTLAPKAILYTSSTALITGVLITYLITNKTWYTPIYFKILFMALLIYTLISFLVKKQNADVLEAATIKPVKFLNVGIFTGVVTALSGLGGGIIMIPAFRNGLKLDMKTAAGISIGVIPIMLIPMMITYISGSPTEAVYHWGYLIPKIFLPIAFGMFFASPLGVNYSKKLSDKTLQLIFSILVVVILINTTYQVWNQI
jgi:uncharacterized membrane protein YfcA